MEEDPFSSTNAWGDVPSLAFGDVNQDYASSGRFDQNQRPEESPFRSIVNAGRCEQQNSPQLRSVESKELLLNKLTLNVNHEEESLSNAQKLSKTLSTADVLSSSKLKLHGLDKMIVNPSSHQQQIDTQEIVPEDSESKLNSPSTSPSKIPNDHLSVINSESVKSLSMLSTKKSSDFLSPDSKWKKSTVNMMSSVLLEPSMDPLSLLLEQAPPPTSAIFEKATFEAQISDSLFFDPIIPPMLSKVPDQSFVDSFNTDISLNKNLPFQPLSKPLIEISVTEPTNIKDIIGSHTSYRIVVHSTLERFKQADFSVTRRFKDFYFLYHHLIDRYPGVIVPPIPEKVVMGRFQDEFIENRRVALEKCLRKIAIHPILIQDEGFLSFLEDATWNVQRKKEVSKSSLFGFAFSETAPKVQESDPEMEKKIASIDSLEIQLKELYKVMDGFIRQRKEFAQVTGELGQNFIDLAKAEVNEDLSHNLTLFGNLQQAVKVFHEKQTKEDFKHIIFTIEEYLRTVASVRIAISSRAKALLTWRTAESNLLKKKEALDKAQSSSVKPLEKISKLGEEIKDCISEEKSTKLALDDITKILKKEIEQFELQKIIDFKDSVKEFLKSLLDTQREIVQLWESYSVKCRPVQPTNVQ